MLKWVSYCVFHSSLPLLCLCHDVVLTCPLMFLSVLLISGQTCLLQGEFWLGLSKIHSLVAQGNSVLRIHLEDWKHNKRFIEYTCDLEGPESNYTLHLKLLSGDLSDPMKNHTGMMFSTKDRDNNKHRDSNCAHNYTGEKDVISWKFKASSYILHLFQFSITLGGWWFNSCGDTNLNGRYFRMRHKGRSDRRRGIHLKPGRKAAYSLRFTQISVFPFTTSSQSSETGGFLANSNLWTVYGGLFRKTLEMLCVGSHYFRRHGLSSGFKSLT